MPTEPAGPGRSLRSLRDYAERWAARSISITRSSAAAARSVAASRPGISPVVAATVRGTGTAMNYPPSGKPEADTLAADLTVGRAPG